MCAPKTLKENCTSQEILSPGPLSGEKPETSSELNDSVRSNCCYSHDWPYFRNPVHRYGYSGDWDLEDEWNRRLHDKRKRAGE